MAVWREEVFGPVGPSRGRRPDEAIAAVNDSVYGLAAGVFTRSLQRAHEFARRVEAGQVAVNLPTPGWDVHLPFGGFGASGSPFKEQGAEALRFYSRVKTVDDPLTRPDAEHGQPGHHRSASSARAWSASPSPAGWPTDRSGGDRLREGGQGRCTSPATTPA